VNKINKMKKNKDIDVENFLSFGDGNPSCRAKKSLGYPNPVENMFDYIDDEMQNPDHCVIERGMPTRLLNKSFKEDNIVSREIM